MAILRRSAVWGGALAAGAVLSSAVRADDAPVTAADSTVPIKQTDRPAPPAVSAPPLTATPPTSAVPTAAPCASCSQNAAGYAGMVPVGEYRVGHIHQPLADRLFFHDSGYTGHYAKHSFFNPYIQEVHAPLRRTVFRGQLEPYYTRTYYLPNADSFYSPGTYYGGTVYGSPAFGGAAYGARQTNYGTAGAAPGFPTAEFPDYAPPAPESAAYAGADTTYSGSPGFFAPYGYAPNSPANAGAGPYPFGVGARSYFGGYGPQGW